MNVEELIPPVAQMLGVDPATALLLFGLLVTGSNVVSRIIPDDKTGVLGFLRKATAFVGLHAKNRVTTRMTLEDAAVITLREQGVDVGERLTDKVFEKVGDVTRVEYTGYTESGPIESDQQVRSNDPLFPRVTRDPSTGKFQKIGD